MPSEVLLNVFAARNKIPRPSLLHCGDDAGTKKVAAGLIRDVGYEPVGVGALRMARYLEPFAMVVAQLACDGKWSPELVCRFEKCRG